MMVEDEEVTNDMQDYRYRFVCDQSHGWLVVPVVHLFFLGLEDKISSSSYPIQGSVWLEEDCDLRKFTMAYEQRIGKQPHIEEEGIPPFSRDRQGWSGEVINKYRALYVQLTSTVVE